MSSLKERLLKNSKLEYTAQLDESELFNNKDVIQTPVHALNIALSGALEGGLSPGLTLFCGPSKHFKTGYSLLCAKAYMDKYPDAIVLFYDNEFGAPRKYWEAYGIDMSRVIHKPFTQIEELKFDLMSTLEDVKRGEHIFILIDSIGNAASKKEVEDALKESGAADMTRAKQLKSVFRMVTPHLTIKDIPMVVVNHIYMEQGMYPKAIVSGGCLDAESLITMADGSYKAISEIAPGEFVATLHGPKKVTASWNPETLAEGEPECYEITFEDGTSVICSATHEFLVNDEWVEACDLALNVDVQVS